MYGGGKYIPYPEIDSPDFYEKILHKKEFDMNTYWDYKKPKLDHFQFFPHQKFVKYFISPNTPYNGVLLFHAVGSGKTCSAISIAESFIPYLKNTKNIILTRRDNIKDQFLNNFKYGCTGDKYLNESERSFLAYAQKHKGKYDKEVEYINDKAKKLIEYNGKQLKGNYYFYSHEVFVNRIFGIGAKDIGKQQHIKPEDFNNSVVIVDEVHYAQERDKAGDPTLYEALKVFLEGAKNIKLILLTATPNFNEPYEIADIVNLLRLNDNLALMPSGDDFMEMMYGIHRYSKNKDTVFENISDYKPTKTGIKLFQKYIQGYISFLSGYDPKSFPKIQYEGKVGRKLQQLPVIRCIMSEFQQEYYNQAISRDNQGKGDSGTIGASAKNSMYAANFAIPLKIDGKYKYSSALYKQFVVAEKKDDVTTANVAKKSYNKYLTMPRLEKYSAKYATLVENILNGPGNDHNIFIFNMEIRNTGVNYVSAILKANGFTDYKEKKTKGKTFAVLVGEQAYTSLSYEREIIREFNRPENKDGDRIKIIIATRHLREGIDLKNTTQVHIMDPWWNLSQNDQIIGRAMRAYAHQDLPKKERVIHVYQYVASNKSKKLTEDERKYFIAECKDILGRRVIFEAKKWAIDCYANKPVNQMVGYENGSRMCDYNKCEYKCGYEPDPNKKYKVDASTYVNLWRNDLIYAIKLYIKGNLFKKGLITDFDTIFDVVSKQISNVNEDIIADAIYDMIINKDTIYDGYGREGYLIYRDKYFIFNPKPSPTDESMYVRNLVYRGKFGESIDDWIKDAGVPVRETDAKKGKSTGKTADKPKASKVKKVGCNNPPVVGAKGPYDRICAVYDDKGTFKVHRPTTGRATTCGTGMLGLPQLVELCDQLEIDWRDGLKLKSGAKKKSKNPQDYTIKGTSKMANKQYFCGLIEGCLRDTPCTSLAK